MTPEQSAVLQAARIYGMNMKIENWKSLTDAITVMVSAENPGRCVVPIYKASGVEKELCYSTLPCKLHDGELCR